MRFFYLLGSIVFYLAGGLFLLVMGLPSVWHVALVVVAAITCGLGLWWIVVGAGRAQEYLQKSDDTWKQKATKLRALLHAVRAQQVGMELAEFVTRSPSMAGRGDAAPPLGGTGREEQTRVPPRGKQYPGSYSAQSLGKGAASAGIGADRPLAAAAGARRDRRGIATSSPAIIRPPARQWQPMAVANSCQASRAVFDPMLGSYGSVPKPKFRAWER